MTPEGVRTLEEAVKRHSYLGPACCALHRLHIADGTAQCSLLRVGKKYGFTESESAGIMDGWDKVARGYHIGLSHSSKEEYEAGYELGKRLALSEV